jgi:hypothetical protein
MAEEAAGDSTPAKKPALEAVVTNGFANGNGTAQPQQQQQQQQVNGSVKLGGQVVQVVSNNAAQQFQGQVVQIQGQMVQGQMVQGQMVQGQMVQGQMVQGQMVKGHHQVIQGQVIQGHQMGGQVVQVMTTSSGGGGGQVVHVTGATAAGGTAGQILVSSSGNDAFRKQNSSLGTFLRDEIVELAKFKTLSFTQCCGDYAILIRIQPFISNEDPESRELNQGVCGSNRGQTFKSQKDIKK